MNNPDHYAFKLVCVDESNPLEYEVLEDCNRGNLEEIQSELKKRITKHNIGRTKWMLLPIPKQEFQIHN